MLLPRTLPVIAAVLLAALAPACGPNEPPPPVDPIAPSDSSQAIAPAVQSASAAAVEEQPAPQPVDSAQEPAPQPAQPEQMQAPSPCPDDMVLIEGQHCYQFEQVCLQWDDPEGQPARRVCSRFQEPSTCTTRRHSMRYCIDRDEYHTNGEELPKSGVSWQEASRLCNAQGKRLCRDIEWEFACEGEQGLPYPYGYERSPSLCNTDRLLRDGKYHAKKDLREPAHATCVSPFGVRDMVGNVDEWVARRYHKPPNRSELRGGWWMTGRNRCRALTTSHDERYSDRQTGFRCCKGLEDPGTAAPEPVEGAGEAAEAAD